jgi:HD-like signal output (HDOD) protein
MTATSFVKPQFDRARILQAANALGLIGSGADSLARLMNLLCDPRAGCGAIASLIENHPVLCARVLRVANSAYYGQQRSIKTIKQAVLLLGLDAIRGVAAAACIDRATPRRMQGDMRDIPALLQHSLATAIAAESLAHIRHPSLAAEAFVAGVMHNLGVAVQISIDRLGVNAIIESRRHDTTRGIRLLESEHASVRHEQCVATILDAWQLPEALVAATGHHHDPSAVPAVHRNLTALVNLGATLALVSGHTFSLEPVATENPIETSAANQLGITSEELDRIANALPERVEKLQRALVGV